MGGNVTEQVRIINESGSRHLNVDLKGSTNAAAVYNVDDDGNTVGITASSNCVNKYYTSAGQVTDGIIWSPAADKKWHITSLYIQVSADTTLTLEDDKSTGDRTILKSQYKAGSGVSITFSENYPLKSDENGADLLVSSTSGNIYITVAGYEV